MKIQKTNKQRYIAMGTLSVMALGGVAATSTPARADADTWKKVAIGAGIVTGYGLIKGKGKVSTIGAVATAGSYYMYSKKKKEEESQRQAWYQQRYGRNWRNHYQSGR